jgi:hypothetical protein
VPSLPWHFLRHWPADQHAFDAERERYVYEPGNLQGGSTPIAGSAPARRAQIKGEAPPLPRIDVPTRVFWSEHDAVLKSD